MVDLEGLVGLTFWVVSVVNDIANVEINSHRVVNNEHCFNGVISTACTEHITDGWQMHLKSSQILTALNLTYASVAKNDSLSFAFVLENLPENTQCLEGENIQVEFSACTPQDVTLQIMVQFFTSKNLCPELNAPKQRDSIQVPVTLLQNDDFGFRALLRVTLPVTIQGNWTIHLATSTGLSQLNAAGVNSFPSKGYIFTITNQLWEETLIAEVTYALEISGIKAAFGITDLCVSAVIAWEKDMEVDSTTIATQTTPSKPTAFSTTVVGEIILKHECGDVIVSTEYNYLETKVTTLVEWEQGFAGQITFTTTLRVRDGWQVVLVMDKEISLLNVHIVTTTPSSGKRFTLRNRDFNKELESGSNITIDFEATKANENDKVPCMRAVFLWAVEKPCPKIDRSNSSNFINATVNITNQWNEGLSGEISLVVPAEVQNGWKIKVLFDVPLKFTVYGVISSPLTYGTLFTLTNEFYNEKPEKGTTLVVAFTAIKQDIESTVLCADAIFLW